MSEFKWDIPLRESDRVSLDAAAQSMEAMLKHAYQMGYLQGQIDQATKTQKTLQGMKNA